MKKLKTLFSPRKLVVWLSIIVLIFTLPNVNEPAMSQTDAIVTMLCVDKVDDKIKVATTVLTPSQDKKANYQVFSGEGETLGSAVDSVSLAIGKEMGFAQCGIMALGDSLCDEGVMQVLDYMTRTKKVGRNAILINFTGEIIEFAQAVSNLSLEKSLNLDEIINFDKRYILSQDSNIETFYIGYYNNVSLGIMPKIKMESEEDYNSIEVANTDSGSNSDMTTTGGGGEDKKFIVNDGTTSVFKDGKRYIDITPDMVEKINLFINDAQKGSIVIDNVSDHIYDDAKIVLNILKKDTKIKPKFENGVPVYNAEVSLTVFIDEIIEDNINKKLLTREQDFLTSAVVEKIKEKVRQDMLDATSFCVSNDVDLLSAYKYFYNLKNKQFEEYLSTLGEKNYLDGINFNIDIKVKSEN